MFTSGYYALLTLCASSALSSHVGDENGDGGLSGKVWIGIL